MIIKAISALTICILLAAAALPQQKTPRYEIDYRGRGGSLNKYEIRYNANAERFEGKLIIQTKP